MFNPNIQNFILNDIISKIIGKAGLQIGADWCITIDAFSSAYGENNIQAWNSDWFSDTGGKFIIIIDPYKE